MQGMLELAATDSQEMLAEIAGLDAVSPSTGGRGPRRDSPSLLVAAAYFRHLGQKRTTVLIPDAAHGTNPGQRRHGWVHHRSSEEQRPTGTGRSGRPGRQAERARDGSVHDHQPEHPGVSCFERPDRLGLPSMVHKVGGLVYLDGANMNAILGIARPGDFGAGHDALQSAQDLQRPSRRRRTGGRPNRGDGLPWRRSCRRPWSSARERRTASCEYDFGRPQVDRPRFAVSSATYRGAGADLLLPADSQGPDGLRQGGSENAVLAANYLSEPGSESTS